MEIDCDRIDARTLALQQWGIRPIPDEERLDLGHGPQEFVEFGSRCLTHRQEYVQ
jgi:hypothetical protein